MLELMQLGFPADACRMALQETGDIARAAEWLFDEGAGVGWLGDMIWFSIYLFYGFLWCWGAKRKRNNSL